MEGCPKVGGGTEKSNEAKEKPGAEFSEVSGCKNLAVCCSKLFLALLSCWLTVASSSSAY